MPDDKLPTTGEIRNDGGPAFPGKMPTGAVRFFNDGRPPERDAVDAPGMSLRDYFATTVDKDEYGDIIYRNMTQELKEALAGPAPKELTREESLDPGKRAAWRLANLDFELRIRAVIRYRMADIMLAERSK